MNNRTLGLGAIMMIALVSTIIGIGVTPILLQQQSAYGIGFGGGVDDRKAPIATSGDNTYITW
jgi:uncharacterized protein (UPF0333 family)